MAARTAASSFATPLAKEATRLVRARPIEVVSPASTLRRIIKWNSAIAALLYDQEGVQKVIDRLAAMKALLPERVDPEPKEATN